MAGLLTYSRFLSLPIKNNLTVALELKTVVEFTAAGQLQSYTAFPFNSGTKMCRKPKALQK